MDRAELAGWLRLSLTPGIGDGAARRLLAAFGLPADVFAQSETALRQVVSEAQAAALRQMPPNLQALIDSQAEGNPARICAVIANRADAFGLIRAQGAGIPTTVLDHKAFDGREAFDAALRAVGCGPFMSLEKALAGLGSGAPCAAVDE